MFGRADSRAAICEVQGLAVPRRLGNGYRIYDDNLLDRLQKIPCVIDAGIPTRTISDILACLDQPQKIVVAEPDPELREPLMHAACGCLRKSVF